MSERLLWLAGDFKVDNRIVLWDELISTDTLLNELGHALTRCGWPRRTFEEIRQELLRLRGRWNKQQYKSESYLRYAAKNPFLWSADSDDEDDIFMPSSNDKTTASSKGKSTASLKGKSTASSKGKSVASMEDDDDAFM
jgi:hypothetical protein